MYISDVHLRFDKIFIKLSCWTCVPIHSLKVSKYRKQNTEFSHHPKLYTPSTLNIQIKLILLWIWAERAVLGRAKTALKFKYEIEIG